MEMTVREGTPVRGVIFDKDGTLHDTERVFRRAWLAAGEEMNVPDMEDTILHCTGMNLHDIGLYWAQKYPDIPFEPYIRLRNRIFDQLVAERIPLRPGAMEVLHTLRARGYRLGLAGIRRQTNQPRSQEINVRRRLSVTNHIPERQSVKQFQHPRASEMVGSLRPIGGGCQPPDGGYPSAPVGGV